MTGRDFCGAAGPRMATCHHSPEHRGSHEGVTGSGEWVVAWAHAGDVGMIQGAGPERVRREEREMLLKERIETRMSAKLGGV